MMKKSFRSKTTIELLDINVGKTTQQNKRRCVVAVVGIFLFSKSESDSTYIDFKVNSILEFLYL